MIAQTIAETELEITQTITNEDPEETLSSVEDFLREHLPLFGPMQKENNLGRQRVLPELALWSGLFVCILRKNFHQNDIWKLLTLYGVWGDKLYKLKDQAVYNRLDQKNDVLELFFQHVSSLLRQRLQPYAQKLAPQFPHVYAIDATKLEQVKRLLPSLRDIKPSSTELLAGQIHGAFDLRTQQWARILRIDQPKQNEKVTFLDLALSLEQGSLFLFDKGYFSFPLFDSLTECGYSWVTRQREKTSYEITHVFYDDGKTRDALVWLGAHRADKAKHLVRLVEFEIGKTTYSYLTNVLDPKRLSLNEIGGLYMRRWDIEMAFRALKQHLGLHFLNSSKKEVLWHQIWATLTISQITQGMRLEIAAKANVDVFEVSMELLCKESPQLVANGRDPIKVFVEQGRFFLFIRPSRRTQNKAPSPLLSEYNLHYDGETQRKHRYAGRKATSRTTEKKKTPEPSPNEAESLPCELI
jgi:hypothetical protein